ncbi:MAG TPA: tetratricopeptide repeat protein [Holophagaceae bacterium]|nr:tetratricopeptide repeat protein [Holophagaceae bacterium]
MSEQQEPPDSPDAKRQEAMEVVGKAYQLHMKGDLDKAIELYTDSIEVCPTAEAYTFRGWAKSFEKDFQAAIEDCHRAIDLDPEFGNPYNDIGAYYLEQGEMDDAIPWLKMALKAQRYESYCFPHFNLGRVYERRGDLDQALKHYRAALDENPRYAVAAKAIERVKAKLAPKEGEPSAN